MIDKAKLQEAFSDKEYLASIAKLNAEDAAASLREKGVEVTADDLMQLRDFLVAHKDELENGELSEDTLAEISGGASTSEIIGMVFGGIAVASAAAIGGLLIWLAW